MSLEQINDLVTKRKSTSVIWEYFGFSRDDASQSHVICKTCKTIVAAKHGNTSNLFQHLRQRHKELYDQCMEKKSQDTNKSAPQKLGEQKSIIHAFASCTPYETNSKRHKEITDAVTYHLCKDMMPANIVSKAGFQKMIHALDKRYQLPSRSFFFKENLSQGLRDALASWGLSEAQQVSITTDNGSNIVKAAALNKWTRLQCFGHRLHLAIENAADDCRISRVTGLCKKLVGHFSHSWKKKMMLTEAQEQLQLPKHALITECPTRWGTRQRMIERVLEQQKALSQVLSADRKARHLVPQWQDIDVLELVNKALSPLQEFTDALSGEDYVSVSYLKPLLHLFNTKILAVDDEDSDLTKTIKSKILEYMNKNYDDEDTQELLDMASFLDPRFKTSYIVADKLPNIKAKVMSDIKYISDTNAMDSESTTRRENEDTDLPPRKKSKKSLGSFFKSVSAMPASMQLDEAIASEVNSYMLTPSIDSEEDPLLWWKLHQINFPRLSRLAQKYLCVPATSSPSERVFSTGGNVVTCQRACLKPEMVDMLVFVAKNL